MKFNELYIHFAHFDVLGGVRITGFESVREEGILVIVDESAKTEADGGGYDKIEEVGEGKRES